VYLEGECERERESVCVCEGERVRETIDGQGQKGNEGEGGERFGRDRLNCFRGAL
jgi:hypothetical protein